MVISSQYSDVMDRNTNVANQRHADIYAAAIHDQANSSLRSAVFAWDSVSGNMSPGNRFVVSNRDHHCFGIKGTILRVMPNNTFAVNLDTAVLGRRAGEIKRSDIRRLGYRAPEGHLPHVNHHAQLQALETYQMEVEIELERIHEIEQHDTPLTVREDMDGEAIYVGDLVYVAPGNGMQHRYKGWLCYVSRIHFAGTIILHLGMPP